MVKRTVNAGDGEPEQGSFEKPSEGEHLFQVVDVFDQSYDGNKFDLDSNTVIAKCEVVGGDEEGRSLLNRCSLDDTWKGFFATRLFLKAIGEPYKGQGLTIDTDAWVGRQFYATVVHNESKGKTYANIKEYNFEKMVDNSGAPTKSEEQNADVLNGEIAWDDDVK